LLILLTLAFSPRFPYSLFSFQGALVFSLRESFVSQRRLSYPITHENHLQAMTAKKIAILYFFAAFAAFVGGRYVDPLVFSAFLYET
jgi:hypothetical protein